MTTTPFTVLQANKMLPLISHIVTDVVRVWKEIINARIQLEEAEKQGAIESIKVIKLELNELIDKINSYVKEVEALGCFIEEFKRGIISIPSLFHGRKVFLCWSLGEKVIEYWHELDEIFSDRVPVTVDNYHQSGTFKLD